MAGTTSASAVESLCFTITDDEEVLELIISHPGGIVVRDAGEWVDLNLAEDNPTVEDLEWLDVSEEAIAFWDSVAQEDTVVSRDDVVKYALTIE